MARRRRRLRGLGFVQVGLGRDIIPPAVGIGLTALVTISIRSAVTPAAGGGSAVLYKAAPWIGAGAGVLGGVAMGMVGTQGQAAATVMTSVVTGLALVALEHLNLKKPGAIAALVGSGATTDAGGAVAGLRAIVPEYPDRRFATRGLGAIVMERLNGNQQNQGADIQLRGVVNPGAFGTKVTG